MTCRLIQRPAVDVVVHQGVRLGHGQPDQSVVLLDFEREVLLIRSDQEEVADLIDVLMAAGVVEILGGSAQIGFDISLQAGLFLHLAQQGFLSGLAGLDATAGEEVVAVVVSDDPYLILFVEKDGVAAGAGVKGCFRGNAAELQAG